MPEELTPRIDAWRMPPIEPMDPKVEVLLANVGFALTSLQSGREGPFTTIEAIMKAIDDFAEDWNR